MERLQAPEWSTKTRELYLEVHGEREGGRHEVAPARPDMSTPLCGADKTDGSGKCRHQSGWGTDHLGHGPCRKHGGNTPNHVKAGRIAKAREAVAILGLPREVDPHYALLNEVHSTAGHVAWLASVVADLEHAKVTQGVTKTVQLPDGTRRVEAEAAFNVWVRLYQDERDRLVRVARAAVDAGVAERHVQLAEQQAARLAQVVSAILSDLGHDLDDENTRKVVRLRLLEGGARETS